jgi:ABC-type multidrug transport system ATPase subunit
MKAIEVENLSRAFNSLRAVDNISFSVDAGEIFGFLGHNGAGKTTTIRMLSGQLLPTSGRGRVAGCDIVTEQQRLKPLIGVVSEHQNLYERMSGRENLEFAARLYGQDIQRVDAVLKQVDLLDRAKDKVQNYSNGMKQRLLIARSILHQPQIVFLDEPTRGLDPDSGTRDSSLDRRHVEAGSNNLSHHSLHGGSRPTLRSGRISKRRTDSRAGHSRQSQNCPRSTSSECNSRQRRVPQHRVGW